MAKRNKLIERQIPKMITMQPTPTDFDLITRLQAKLGISISATIRLALNRLAEAEGVKAA